MSPEMLKQARQERGWTETRAARRLRMSQSYLAMLETGERRVTPELVLRFKRVYGLGAAVLPVPEPFVPRKNVSSAELANLLSRLGYPGFLYLKARAREASPAVVLLEALNHDALEARVVEALPWLLLQYWDMDTTWLVRQAKLNDVQNRLGFSVSLALDVARRSKAVERTRTLEELRNRLEPSRLTREDTFLKPANSEAEREWLKQNRSEEARFWNLLTNWRPEHLPYGP